MVANRESDGEMTSRQTARKARRLKEKEMVIRQEAALHKVRMEYPTQRGLSSLTDWLAVFTAFTSFIFLIAWQSWPDSDYMEQAQPIFIRTVLVSVPLTLGMWGVTRAVRNGSAVPKEMAEKLPLAQVSPDGSIGGTTYKDIEAGNDPIPLTPKDPTTVKGTTDEEH